MRNDLKTVGLVTLAVVALVAIIAGVRGYLEAKEWEARVETTLAESALLMERARFLEREADRWEARANELVIVAADLRAEADSAATDLVEGAEEFEERIADLDTPPDLEGHPAIAERDTLILDLYEANGEWLLAYGKLASAYDSLTVAHAASMSQAEALRTALWQATAAVDSLTSVLEDRPGASPWWKPIITVGPSVGLSGGGNPYAGVGVTVGWKITP